MERPLRADGRPVRLRKDGGVDRRSAIPRPHNPREEGSTCTSTRHGTTKGAWDRGCRCPKAVAARTAWKNENSRTAPAALNERGECVAERHGTINAYRTAGCRCPEAVLKRDRALRHKREIDPRYDPRRRWRGPAMRVDRLTLWFLLEGTLWGKATRGEYVAAIIALDARADRFGEPVYSIGEIANRLHISVEDVRRFRVIRDRNRAERDQRRLADVRWKILQGVRRG